VFFLKSLFLASYSKETFFLKVFSAAS